MHNKIKFGSIVCPALIDSSIGTGCVILLVPTVTVV